MFVGYCTVAVNGLDPRGRGERGAGQISPSPGVREAPAIACVARARQAVLQTDRRIGKHLHLLAIHAPGSSTFLAFADLRG